MKRLLTISFSLILTILLSSTILSAQNEDIKEIKSSLPEMLGANNAGKEFYITIPPCYEETTGDNFIKIFVTSAVRTLCTVECSGSGLYMSKNTVANDVIEFNITPVQGQPFTKGFTDPNVPERIFPGKGIHITADQPLVVYVVVRYRATSDGFLALPVSSFGKEYIVAGWNVDAMFKAVWNGKSPNMTGVVAAYNDTRIRFTLGGNVLTRTAGGMTPGQSKEFVLQEGDVWMVSTDADEADLSGSKVVGTKPFGIVTGNFCNNIPTGNQWCDYTVEMDIPTYTWGLDYHVAKIPGRKFSSIIRIFGKEPNTNIFKDGKQIGQIKTGGGTEGNGFLTMRMVPMDVEPRSVLISGDKPIGVTLYNTGVQEDGNPAPNSDPFVMTITPLQQYQKDITFCTPGILGGQGFNENYINLVYETNELGMMGDDFEFARVQGGQVKWEKLRTKYPGIDELFVSEVMGKKFAAKTITLSGDGVYKIRANHLFAAYSFGYASYDSYGFPTSAALADLEKPDTNCPVPTYIVNCDGSVKGGIVTDMPDDSKIRSNLAMILMDDLNSFNYNFSYLDFIPGETRTTTWELQVIDPTKNAQASLVFTDRRGNDTTIVVKYYPVMLGIEPKDFDFGLLKFGSAKVSQDFNVVNESSTAPAVVTEVKLQKANQNFEIDLLGATLPLTLQPNEKLPFKVWFDPAEMGSFLDSIGVGDTCFFAYKSQVKAKVSEPIINVSDIDFGVRSTIDPVITKEFTITNSGKSELTITKYVGPTLPEYTAYLPAADGSGNLLTPLVLNPGELMKFNVDFLPTTVSTFNDQIEFISDAGTKIDNVCLITGRSIQPGLRTRDYDWQRVRIDRPAFPRGPYQPAEPTIWFFNDGSEDVLISDVNVTVVKGDATAFKYNITDFYSLVVPKGDSVVVPVTFQPKATGEYEIHLDFVNDAGIAGVTSKLKGIGIVPVLRTSDYDFGTTVVSDFNDIKTNNIVFENVSYEWEDTVYVQDFVMGAAGSIAEDMVSWGSEGFHYDKAALGIPVLLNPGETIEFNAEFVAAHIGDATATLSTISEAEADVTSLWTGFGFSQFVALTGGSANICVGSTTEITCTITNSGSGTITVGPLSLDPVNPYLDFKQPNPWTAPVALAAGETRDVVLVYAPGAVINETVELVVPTSILEMPEDRVDVVISSVHYEATAKANVLDPNLNRPWPQIGDAVPCNITFTRAGGADISMAQVTELDVTVNYNGGILKLDRNSLQTGSALPGFVIQNVKVDDQMGEFSFTISHPSNNIINVDGEIAKFNFGTFLPTSKDTSDISILSQMTNSVGNLCIAISNEDDEVQLIPTCAYDLRWIATTGVQYAFNSIAPNPVDAGGTSIDFSVGLEAWTEINIYNTLGELVAMPVGSVLKPGHYTIDIPVTNLNSGAYMIRMVSGPFSKTQDMIIRK